MWRKSDGAPEAGEASLFLEMAQDGPVRLPESFPLAASRFERVGTDLQLTGPEGEHAVVRDYFLNGEAADLVSPAGARFPGQLVTELAGPLSPAQVAAAGRGVVAEAIGKVDNITGNATAIRADGTHVELEAGDPVYQGDVLTTGPEGAIGIVLADDTSFAMSQNGRMVLDELIYDPGTQEGSIALSVVQGLFAFVSGQIAKMNPEAMTVETPVATIGIRGTQMGREIPDGQNLQVVLMEELDAFVGEVIVRNKAGLVVLNEANQFTVVSDFGLPPNAIQVISLGDLVDRFSGPLSHLPIHQGTENTYGVDSTVPGGFDSLDSFDTAAGGDGSVVGGTDDGTGQGGGDQTINVVGDDYTGTPDRLDGDIGGGFGVPGRGGDLGASTPQGLNGNDQFAGLATGAVGATGGQLVDGVWTQSVSGFYDGSGRIEPQNILGGGGNDTIIAGPGNDRVEGLGGDDVIEGRGGDDVLIGTDGDDIIYGGDGDDTIIGGTGAGDDLYDGQAGNDTAAYGSTGLGVIVDLAAGTASGEEIDDDRLISIENAIGGGGDDIIVGNDGANRLDGGAGNDILAGGAMATTGSPAARASTRPSMPVPTPTIWSPLTGRTSSYPAPKASTA